MTTVSFYVVPGAREVPLKNGGVVAGYWSPAGELIVLAELYQMSGAFVRHEMLHALIRQAGHSRGIFLDRCAGVVHCGPTCVSDAGPAPVPPASIALVGASQLVLELEVSPQLPRLGEYGGFFSVTVTARNPLAEPVLVGGASTSGRGFSLNFSGAAGDFFQAETVIHVENSLFAAGETKRHVYDFRIGSRDATGWAYPPGEYSMRGGYGNVWTPFRALTLAH